MTMGVPLWTLMTMCWRGRQGWGFLQTVDFPHVLESPEPCPIDALPVSLSLREAWVEVMGSSPFPLAGVLMCYGMRPYLEELASRDRNLEVRREEGTLLSTEASDPGRECRQVLRVSNTLFNP